MLNINNRIYIGNINYEITGKQIRDVFENFGKIIAIQIRNGFAFVVKFLHKYL